jgi:3-deoxy-D-manno-octulosonic-acid transferase
VLKKYPNRNIFYLPRDSASNAKKFLDVLRPSLAIFIKYEFWFHFLNQLHQRKIPCFLAAATFRKEQLFFRSYGKFYLQILDFFDQIYVQDTASMRLLKQYNIEHVYKMGDTRIDQVIVNKNNASETSPALNSFFQQNPCIVFGSVWPEDYQLIKYIIEKHKGYKIIIAPHEIDSNSISKLIRYLENYSYLLYSSLEDGKENLFDVLIIDNIGLLKYLYRFGNMAYIGGGFGKGIHNILEAAVYGIPILFGPNYHKFNEAVELIELSCAYSVSDTNSLDSSLSKIEEKGTDFYKNQLNSYFENHRNASRKIYQKINEKCINTQ